MRPAETGVVCATRSTVASHATVANAALVAWVTSVVKTMVVMKGKITVMVEITIMVMVMVKAFETAAETYEITSAVGIVESGTIVVIGLRGIRHIVTVIR